MASFETLVAFLFTAGLFAFLPGPAMLYVAAQTLARGRRAGVMAALGVQTGGYAHVLAAAAGLSVLFHAVPFLFLAVKLGGALYLIWLGIGMIRSKPEDAGLPEVTRVRSARRAFFESVTVEALNPKTAIFFLAFLPQFVDPAGALPIWVQFLVLGTVVNLIFSAADLAAVLLAGVLATRLQRSARARRMMQRAGGALIVGLGLNLALQRA